MKYFEVIRLEGEVKYHESVEAQSKRELLTLLKMKFPNSIILDISEKRPTLQHYKRPLQRSTSSFFKRHIPLKDKIAVIRQIAVMSEAGISFHVVLKEVSNTITHPRLHTIYKEVSHSIHAGSTLYQALKPYQSELGMIILAMTKLGEETGNISKAYQALIEMLETMQRHQHRFKKSLRTPLITLSAMGIAFVILMLFVVPKFTEIFKRFKGELPLPTQILLWLEQSLQQYGWIVLGFVMTLVFVIRYRYQHTPRCRYWIDRLMVHHYFYFVHQVLFTANLYQYHLLLSALLKAGIPLSHALHISVNMVENHFLKERLTLVNTHLSKGIEVTEAYRVTGLYPNMLLEIIKLGEKSAQLPQMLEKITAYYKEDLEKYIERVSSYLEPILMLFISLLVLMMALGIFMPMWELSGVMG